MKAVGACPYGTDRLCGLPECMLALDGDAIDRKSSMLSSFGPGSSVVYRFGLLFRHLLMPNPTSTNNASATSMMAMIPTGTTTICRSAFLGQMAPLAHWKGSTVPLGQNVPAGHGIDSFPPGGQ